MKKFIAVFLLIFCVTQIYVGCKKDNPKTIGDSVKIQAKFVADNTVLAQGDVVNFSDSTSGFPLTWKWYFEGGVPGISNIQHPKNIKYNELGEYSVTLVVTNAYGSDSIVRKGYIKVRTEVNPPTVTTIQPYEIDPFSAKGGGEVLHEGTAKLLEAGICWGLVTRPTVNDFVLSAPKTELGDFTFKMEGLEEKTTYYYRAFARSAAGINYGLQYTFTTLEVDTCEHIIERFTDNRNGEVYRYTEIGGKIWMGDNLNYPISGSWCYGDLEENCDRYGRLYSIEAAKQACPVGWRLPTNQEWDDMIIAVGDNAGVKLKTKNTWNPAPASNDFCFSAVPAGYRNLETGTSSTANFFGYWWTSSKNSENLNVSKHVSYDNSVVQTIAYDDNMAFSVRCIRN